MVNRLQPHRPHLTRANAPLTFDTFAVNEFGDTTSVAIPAERALTVYVDKRELVTLMTLGANPEWLVLGYLLNQRLIKGASEIHSITVDWDVGAAAVKTRAGIENIEEKTSKRVVTTGCGQGSVFGDLMSDLDNIELPHATLAQSQLYGIVNAIRLKESTYKSAGSVHACALFCGEELLLFVEDVGRHNAIDAIAGWMAMQTTNVLSSDAEFTMPRNAATSSKGDSWKNGSAMRTDDKIFYTTGRLTSEMVIKSAQMGVPIVISRSGITQMGRQVALRLGLCAIGRATNKHFLCYTGVDRLVLNPELAGARPVPVNATSKIR